MWAQTSMSSALLGAPDRAEGEVHAAPPTNSGLEVVAVVEERTSASTKAVSNSNIEHSFVKLSSRLLTRSIIYCGQQDRVMVLLSCRYALANT
jgi:hypothetical protein